MKNFGFIVISILILACNEPAEKQILKTAGMSDNFCSADDKKRLLSIVEGGWVNVEYIEAFNRLHSPMAVSTEGLPIQQIAFDISNLSGDTLLNGLGRMNYNEAERFDIVFYKGKDGITKMKLKQTNADSLTDFHLNYLVKEKDTLLEIKVTEGKKQFEYYFKRQFRKFPGSDEIPATAKEYFVNNAMVSGDWNAGGKKISFSENGIVENFKSFQKYSITISDPQWASRPDEISFYNDSTGVTYAFVSNGNELQFYELHESEDGMKFSRGKLIAQLKRIAAKH
ncbi:hypothetical protein BH09BAC5_BH09BAC5_29890 [soil metagenome]